MDKHTVAIEEHFCQEFEVEAEDDEMAYEIAMEKYQSGEFALERGEVTAKLMSVDDSWFFEF